MERRKKTNRMLITVTIIFFVSWAPLNIFTVVTNTTTMIEEEQTLVLIFGVCHLVGMTTAVTNPIVYVWLNNNFKSAKPSSALSR